MTGGTPAAAGKGPPVTWDDGYPVPPALRWPAAVVLFAATGIAVLDLTIANVAVPHIAGNLGATLEQGTWVITSYAVAEAIAVPLTGWLVARFGAVRMLLFVMLGFCGFSLLCGLSVTLPMLVGSRIGQGICGGLLMPLSQTLFFRIFPPPKLPIALALWTLTFTIAPAVGPIVGGMIVDSWSWHWVFLINVPIGVVAAGFGYVLLRHAETQKSRVPIDAVGLVLLVLWVGALQIVLDTGREKDWFADAGIVGLAVVAVVSLCAFIVWEFTEEHPIVDIRLLRSRAFTMCQIGTALAYGSYFIGIVVVPQWLQSVMGYTATQAGLVTAASAVSGVLASQITLRLMLRVDIRWVVMAGGLISGGAMVLRTIWNTDLDMVQLAVTFGAMGLGVMMMQMPLGNAALSSVPYSDAAAAAGLSTFVRTTSAAMATALALTFWTGQQAVSRDALVQSLHPDASVAAMSASGLPPAAQAAYLGQLVDLQATTVAMLHTFALSAIALLVVAFAVWVLPRIELTRLKGTQEGMGDH